MPVQRMADVRQVLPHRRDNGNIHGGHTQLPGQIQGILMGAVAGAEPGHGHREDMIRGQTHELGRPMADQQGQGGIQAARDTHHSPVDAGIGKAGCQRMALEFEPLPEGAAFGFRFHGQVGGGGEAAQGIVMGHSREAVSCRSRSGGQCPDRCRSRGRRTDRTPPGRLRFHRLRR